MIYDETSVKKPIKESELFSSLDRIDKKIETLRNILSPIICDTPMEAKDTATTTELNGRVDIIETKLSKLIDIIQL